MTTRRAMLVAGLTTGCASPPSGVDKPSVGLLDRPPPTGGRLWTLDGTASRLRSVAFRAGAAGRLGHHHLLEAGDVRGQLWLPEQGLSGAEAELAVPLAALRIDEPLWRAEARGEFDERPLSLADREATKRNLLVSLQADRHPELRMQLNKLVGAAPWWAAELTVVLAGRANRHRAALRVQTSPQALQIDGRLVLRHSDHGLAPFSVLGGLLAVADEVLIDAKLVWR